MTAQSAAPDARSIAVRRLGGGIAVLGVAGLLTIVGGITGVAMALHATRIICPEGTTVAGDGRCFAHHQAGIGTGLAILCAVLLCLIIALGWLMQAAAEVWKSPPVATGVPLSELTS